MFSFLLLPVKPPFLTSLHVYSRPWFSWHEAMYLGYYLRWTMLLHHSSVLFRLWDKRLLSSATSAQPYSGLLPAESQSQMKPLKSSFKWAAAPKKAAWWVSGGPGWGQCYSGFSVLSPSQFKSAPRGAIEHLLIWVLKIVGGKALSSCLFPWQRGGHKTLISKQWTRVLLISSVTYSCLPRETTSQIWVSSGKRRNRIHDSLSPLSTVEFWLHF